MVLQGSKPCLHQSHQVCVQEAHRPSGLNGTPHWKFAHTGAMVTVSWFE